MKQGGSRYWKPTLQKNRVVETSPADEYGLEHFAAFAEDFISRHRERPFLFYYPMALTHDPFVATPDSQDALEPDRNRNNPRWFADMVGYMDRIVGRIVDAVDSHGQTDNTLILFMGDNGTGTSITTQTKNGPVRGGKGGTTIRGTHVPHHCLRDGSLSPSAIESARISSTLPTYFRLWPKRAERSLPPSRRAMAEVFSARFRENAAARAKRSSVTTIRAGGNSNRPAGR